MPGYSEEKARAVLSHAVPMRWPGERLLLLTRCRARRGVAGAAAFLDPGPTGEVGVTAVSEDIEGYLAATPTRLVFQSRTTPATVVRAAGTTFAAGAVLVLVLGGGVVRPLILASIAVILRLASRVMGTLMAASVDVEYGRVAWVDHGLQHLAGVTRGGVPYRFEIRDFSDFRVTLAVLRGLGRADAA
jgi:hypothetical protein